MNILKKIRQFWWNGYNLDRRETAKVVVRSSNIAEVKLEEHINNPLYLEGYGAKAYSQNDEDGIIEEIFNRIGTTNKVFIECGVNNGMECCTHYLLYKGWSGAWIEADKHFYNEICSLFSDIITEDKLRVKNAFITKDNINSLISECGIKGEIDLFSIDIVGNDYHIWNVLDVVSPRVVIMPYNAKFLPTCEWIKAYDENYIWDGSDCQYASLKSIELLGRQLGYTLVGTNANGVNAFLVRNDLLKTDAFPSPATAENLYNPARRWMFFESGRGNEYAKYPLLHK